MIIDLCVSDDSYHSDETHLTDPQKIIPEKPDVIKTHMYRHPVRSKKSSSNDPQLSTLSTVLPDQTPISKILKKESVGTQNALSNGSNRRSTKQKHRYNSDIANQVNKTQQIIKEMSDLGIKMSVDKPITSTPKVDSETSDLLDTIGSLLVRVDEEYQSILHKDIMEGTVAAKHKADRRKARMHGIPRPPKMQPPYGKVPSASTQKFDSESSDFLDTICYLIMQVDEEYRSIVHDEILQCTLDSKRKADMHKAMMHSVARSPKMQLPDRVVLRESSNRLTTLNVAQNPRSSTHRMATAAKKSVKVSSQASSIVIRPPAQYSGKPNVENPNTNGDITSKQHVAGALQATIQTVDRARDRQEGNLPAAAVVKRNAQTSSHSGHLCHLYGTKCQFHNHTKPRDRPSSQ